MSERLRKEIGDRVADAQRRARIPTLLELAIKAGSTEKQMWRVRSGDTLARIDILIAVARVCRVSLDWLVTGQDTGGSAAILLDYFDHHPRLEPAARDFMRRLPLRGYQPSSSAFFDRVYLAWQDGRTPEEATQAAIDLELQVDPRPR